MSVNATLKKSLETTSEIHKTLKPKWDKTRIIFKGEDSVHEADDLLLPKFGNHEAYPELYTQYKERARFLNAFKRTIKGLDGTVKRKEYDVNVEPIEELVENINLAGSTIIDYSNKLLHEGLKIGVCATLVDHNETSNDDLTVAEAEAKNLRPKLSFYLSNSIMEVKYKTFNGVTKKAFVKLKETYEKVIDEFTSEVLDQYRILRLNEEGIYEQQVYKITKEGTVDAQEAFTPKMDDKEFDYIPFFIHGDFVEPPLYDLVTTNIKHYQLHADLNNLLHFVGCPQPVRTGIDPKDETLPTSIGSGVIWDIENEKAKVFYLELEGKSAEHIVTELETIKEEMAFLGAAMIAPDDVEETARKATYRNASETSSLVDIVFDLSESFTKALKLFAEWGGENPDDVHFKYNMDFDITKLTAQEILARVQSWQLGAFSKKSLFKQLKNGEVELESDNFEDEEDLISKGE